MSDHRPETVLAGFGEHGLKAGEGVLDWVEVAAVVRKEQEAICGGGREVDMRALRLVAVALLRGRGGTAEAFDD